MPVKVLHPHLTPAGRGPVPDTDCPHCHTWHGNTPPSSMQWGLRAVTCKSQERKLVFPNLLELLRWQSWKMELQLLCQSWRTWKCGVTVTHTSQRFIWHVKQSRIRAGDGHKCGIATDVTGKDDSSGLKPGNKFYLVCFHLSQLVQGCSTAVWWLSCSAAWPDRALTMICRTSVPRQDATQCCRRWDWRKALMANAGGKGQPPRTKWRAAFYLNLKKCQTENAPNLVALGAIGSSGPLLPEIESFNRLQVELPATANISFKIPGHPKTVRNVVLALTSCSCKLSDSWCTAAGFENINQLLNFSSKF